MNVTLLQYTPDPEFEIARAARLCYANKCIDELEDDFECRYDIEQMVRKIMSLGHLSVLEHASFTFGIEGISRVTSHQLVRHRIASFSQQSQRYVDSGNMMWIMPPSIKDKGMENTFLNAVSYVRQSYKALTDAGVPAEDARYLLPNATETKIIMTMNARELLHFYQLRCCNRAQWEIREMADRMLHEAKEVAPIIFGKAGAACVSGPCPEGPYCCGKPRNK